MGARPGTPKPPGAGRKRGSLDREARQLLSGKMAAAIWKTYRELGEGWLTQLARDKPELFCSIFLQRLLPPALKDPADDSPLVNLNFSGDPTEAARRIAYALAAGAQAQDKPVAEHADVPYSQLAREDLDPRAVCHVDAPDPEREAFYREVQQTPEDRLASETLEEHCNRKAFADRPPRPSWMPAEERPRPYVGVPKSKRD